MSYTTIPTVKPNDLWDKDDFNTYLTENWAASVPDIFTAKGDLAIATGDKAAAVLAAGSDGQVVMADNTQACGAKNATNPSGIEVGMCMMWSGSVASIPSGWHLCDGSGGTPDLRGLFIYGANAADTPGAGGATTHTHTQNDTGNESSHTHSINQTTSAHYKASGCSGSTGAVTVVRSHDHNYSGTTGAGSAHKHTNPTTGSASNLPPYYALCFIKRIS